MRAKRMCNSVKKYYNSDTNNKYNAYILYICGLNTNKLKYVTFLPRKLALPLLYRLYSTLARIEIGAIENLYKL